MSPSDTIFIAKPHELIEFNLIWAMDSCHTLLEEHIFEFGHDTGKLPLEIFSFGKIIKILIPEL